MEPPAGLRVSNWNSHPVLRRAEAELNNSETEKTGLPMTLERERPRPSLQRSEATAAFVSQLLAERNRLPVQRMRRRETPQGAIGAYATGASMATKRMPAGFRKTVVV